jgi:hypothetical protein
MNAPDRLSVPPRRTSPPRALSTDEFAAAGMLADALCIGAGTPPVARPSECAEFANTLNAALAARSDVYEEIVATLRRAATGSVDDTTQWLRQLSAEAPTLFASLSAILAGAYLMIPDIKSYVGYPGQGQNRAPWQQIGDELATGILEPVMERGAIYRTADSVPASERI